MSYVGKKKIDQINMVGFIHDVIERSEYDHDFLDTPPELWQKEESIVYNMLCELDYKLKDAILNIIEGAK